MFAYCGNNPVNCSDSAGCKWRFWRALFEEHDPGYIHRQVQAHIIASSILLEQEFVMPGIGRADIYNPETGEIWEIKHGGSNAETATSRIDDALVQLERYVSNYVKIPLRKGSANAFSGEFVINWNNNSYLITYDTPTDGVVLYYVTLLPTYQTEPFRIRAYKELPALNVQKSMSPAIATLGLVVFAGFGCAAMNALQNNFSQ